MTSISFSIANEQQQTHHTQLAPPITDNPRESPQDENVKKDKSLYPWPKDEPVNVSRKHGRSSKDGRISWWHCSRRNGTQTAKWDVSRCQVLEHHRQNHSGLFGIEWNISFTSEIRLVPVCFHAIHHKNCIKSSVCLTKKKSRGHLKQIENSPVALATAPIKTDGNAMTTQPMAAT